MVEFGGSGADYDKQDVERAARAGCGLASACLRRAIRYRAVNYPELPACEQDEVTRGQVIEVIENEATPDEVGCALASQLPRYPYQVVNTH